MTAFHDLEPLLLLSPLALVSEVREAPHDLWRPSVLQRRMHQELRALRAGAREPRGLIDHATRCVGDLWCLARWLADLREAAAPCDRDPQRADGVRRVVVRVLRRARPAEALAVLRPALHAMPDHEHLRRLEIACLVARGELSPGEVAFALSALRPTG